MTSKIMTVTGGFYGSEAKGAVCGELVKRSLREERDVACIRVGGSNAGHTIVDPTGRHWPFRHVPVASVLGHDIPLILAQGSEVDLEVLNSEVSELEEAGYSVRGRLFIDDSATFVTQEHKDAESGGGLTDKLGSTAKGVGAARAARAMRTAKTVGQALEEGVQFPGQVTDTLGLIHTLIARDFDLVIEGTQGYGLGQNAGLYPFVTSGNCRSIDLIQQVGLSPWGDDMKVEPWVVFRTYPIRVAGNSGPMNNEVDWDHMAEVTGGHAQPERTTVTKKIRRIAEWDEPLAQLAVRDNGGFSVNIALSFLDYVFPEYANRGVDMDDEAIVNFVGGIEAVGANVGLIGTGPDTYTWIKE